MLTLCYNDPEDIVGGTVRCKDWAGENASPNGPMLVPLLRGTRHRGFYCVCPSLGLCLTQRISLPGRHPWQSGHSLVLSSSPQASGPGGILKHRNGLRQPFLNSSPGPETARSRSVLDLSASRSMTCGPLALVGVSCTGHGFGNAVPIYRAQYVTFPSPLKSHRH